MKNISYLDKLSVARTKLIREALSKLPNVCSRFETSIESTTSQLTRLAYLLDLRVFCSFLINEIGGFSDDPSLWKSDAFAVVTVRDIEQYASYLNLYGDEKDAFRTNGEYGKMRKLASLRSFFKYLFKNELIPSDVCAVVDMPKIHEKPILRLEIDEVAKILDAAQYADTLTDKQKSYHKITGVRDLTMLTIFLGTGIRVSECVGLNTYDIDFDGGCFLVTRKGGNQVILYMPDEVRDQLKTYMAWREEQTSLPGHENALFLSIQKRRITVRAVEQMVKKYARVAAPLKPRISPHKLRSTFGTNLYNQTGDIYLVADVLGHSNVDTTRKHYAAMLDERRRRATKSVVLRNTPDDDASRMPSRSTDSSLDGSDQKEAESPPSDPET